MTNVELDVLEAVAKAATPNLTVLLPPSLYEDSWHVRDVDDTAVVRCYGFANKGNGDTARRLAEYIAAANPAVILELIAELRQTQRERKLFAQQLKINAAYPDAAFAAASAANPAIVLELLAELRKARASLRKAAEGGAND